MKAAEIVLSEAERAVLEGWARAGKTERRKHFRARVILGLSEGLSNEEVADRWHTRAATVSKWRGRFALSRLPGQIEDGRMRVVLDRTFGETVALESEYHVFVQSYGDADLVVRNRARLGFEVVRRGAGEDARFSYRIVARRKGSNAIASSVPRGPTLAFGVITTSDAGGLATATARFRLLCDSKSEGQC